VRFLGSMYVDGYFQTWGFSSRLRRIPLVGGWLYAAARALCGKLTGHSPSKTEWGYGGGGFGDVWCRWCNQLGRIPLSELADRYENARSTIWGATQCDIKHKEWKP
jgi:hypothetical protein